MLPGEFVDEVKWFPRRMGTEPDFNTPLNVTALAAVSHD